MPSEINVGGGGFQVGTSSGYQEINVGASGDILVLSNTDNKDVRLDSLSSATFSSSPFGELGVTVNVDGVDLIGGNLAGTAPRKVGVGTFAIQQTGALSGSGNNSLNTDNVGYISDVVGKVITVTKNTGSTTDLIAYSYSTGK